MPQVRKPSLTTWRGARGVAEVLALGLLRFVPDGPNALARPVSDSGPPNSDLRIYALHINRTPVQPWPGFGMYLGNGLVITAAHVPGDFADTKPHVLIGGEHLPAALVRQGALDDVDLTLLSVDSHALPVRMLMRRLPLCETAPFPGEISLSSRQKTQFVLMYLRARRSRRNCGGGSTPSSAMSRRPEIPVRACSICERPARSASSVARSPFVGPAFA